MMIRAQTPTESFASSLDDKARRALVYAAPATKVPRHCVRASVAGDVPGSVEFLKRSALPTLSR